MNPDNVAGAAMGVSFDLAARDRFELWGAFVQANPIRHVAEIGVYRGEFAYRLLERAPSIERYVMVDPWRAIENWNKPANADDRTFEDHYREALRATAFAADKRVILRGKTTEVIDRIEDDSVDFIYVDGDHTLHGISIDLIRTLPKLRDGGWLAGDDFCDSVWQHPKQFEPTLVFPFAAYFAEANDLVIYALPHNQFAMQKRQGLFAFVDFTGSYGDRSILRQVCPYAPMNV